jgi:steroid 5-alpha reductase family enzyme
MIWSCRLNYNTLRKNLFTWLVEFRLQHPYYLCAFNRNEEDYRWAILRQRLSSFQFHVTNLVFVGSRYCLHYSSTSDVFSAIIQNIILFLLSLPVQFAICQPHTSLTTSDYILFGFGVAVHILEFTADNQHQSFHKYKKTGTIDPNDWLGARIQWTPADAKRGFVTRGLWAWSRHPNFLCEQLCWVSVFFKMTNYIYMIFILLRSSST